MLANLTTQSFVGIFDNMKARKLAEYKSVETDRSIIQFVV